jgi:hypothetical protein
MSLVLFLTLLSIFYAANFTDLFNYGYFLYSVASVIVFFIVYILNYHSFKKQSIMMFLASILIYLIYDISFFFVIGNNVIAWCIADMFIFRIKNNYLYAIKKYHVIMFSLLFFTISNMINFVMKNIFIWQIFAYQILLSSLIVLMIFFFKKNN